MTPTLRQVLHVTSLYSGLVPITAIHEKLGRAQLVYRCSTYVGKPNQNVLGLLV